jgi:hypothetical protein
MTSVITRREFIAGVLVGGLLAAPLAAGGQSPLYYVGRVQWIAGSTMVLMTDEGWSLRVDLKRVPQSEYSGLESSDRVVVTGFISEDGNYVIGLSIARTPADYQAP